MNLFTTPPPPREARIARLLDNAQAKISRRNRTIRKMRETNARLRDELARTHEANAALPIQQALVNCETVNSTADRESSPFDQTDSVAHSEVDAEVLSNFDAYARQLRDAQADDKTFMGTTIAIGREVCEIAPSVMDNIGKLSVALSASSERLAASTQQNVALSEELADQREATKSALHELGEEKAAHARVEEELLVVSATAKSRINPGDVPHLFDPLRQLHDRYVMLHQRLERFGSGTSKSIEEVKAMDQAYIDFTSAARRRRSGGARASGKLTVLGKTAKDMSETLDEHPSRFGSYERSLRIWSFSGKKLA